MTERDSPPAPIFRGPARSDALRIPALRSRGSHRGGFVGGTTPTRVLYESALEYEVATVMFARPDVLSYREQCPQYEVAGRTYTFDALVQFRDGRRILVAIKPHDRAKRSDLRGFLRTLATLIPPGDADGIAIVTERHLPRALVQDAELIHSARREASGALDESVVAIAETTVGAVTVEALAEATGDRGSAFRAIVRRIADGDLVLTTPRPITHASRVRRAEQRPTDRRWPGGEVPDDRGQADRVIAGGFR